MLLHYQRHRNDAHQPESRIDTYYLAVQQMAHAQYTKNNNDFYPDPLLDMLFATFRRQEQLVASTFILRSLASPPASRAILRIYSRTPNGAFWAFSTHGFLLFLVN
jgi:hypothetical protein